MSIRASTRADILLFCSLKAVMLDWLIWVEELEAWVEEKPTEVASPLGAGLMEAADAGVEAGAGEAAGAGVEAGTAAVPILAISLMLFPV